jgi:transcriptional regulator with XRE-family HTH domain
MTRLEFSRRSGIPRGTLRDLELGVHSPTRRSLQQFVDFCQSSGVDARQLEEVYRLYAGPGDGLRQFIGRLEFRAGSPAELARRAGISPATLWEYRRGNYPLPVAILHRLCQVVGEDPGPAEVLWFEAERSRFLARGYPAALAEFWTLCSRQGYTEKHLSTLGLSMAALRSLRYLEVPAWQEVAEVARSLCRNEDERLNLEQLWPGTEHGHHVPDAFGAQIRQLRNQKKLTRREVADLFDVGGKKPARIIKSIEEDGCYSAQAYPAGLAALLAEKAEESSRLLALWEERRKQFHARHRPETRIDLRLVRELYGFEHKDMEPILGYSALEYQRIERGVVPLSETAQARILHAIVQAGQHRVEALLRKKASHDAEQTAWRHPPSVQAMVTRLANREGGIIPLWRHLCRCGVRGFWAERLRTMARGEEVPPWPLVERIGAACGVAELAEVRRDWRERYRARLEGNNGSTLSPLGIELRLLLAEVATTVREFSTRLGVNPSVLTRDLQRMDGGKPIRWSHVERILQTAGLGPHDRRWQQIHAWWYTTRIDGR